MKNLPPRNRASLYFTITAGFLGHAALLQVASAPALQNSASAQSPAQPMPKERIVDRIAIGLTGRPAPESLKQEFASGQKDMEAVVEALVASPNFTREYTQFWLNKLKITGVTDFQNIRPINSNADVRSDLNPRRGSLTDSRTLLFRQMLAVSATEPRLPFYTLELPEINVIPTLSATTATAALVEQYKTQLQQEDCRVNTNLTGTETQLNRYYLKAAGNLRAELKAAASLNAADQARLVLSVPHLLRSNLVSVKPWWNPDSTILTCPAIVTKCGQNLESCSAPGRLGILSAAEGSENKFIANLQEAFTREPGVMIAKIVQDNLPWENVMRGTNGVVNGPMEYFLASTWGAKVLQAMPPGSYREGSELKLNANAQVNNLEWRWVKKGALHAGVLTTVAFQKAFNGWRAKSNGAMSAFLCREFKVPEGTAVLASEESDLTRRPYCKSCHSTLEPLSQFFGRWPNLGSTNYAYNPGAGVTANGSFEGMIDADTNGLGRVLSNTTDFQECAVIRAFEYLVGRPMSSGESASMLPNLLNTYSQSQGKIIPVFKAIAKSKLFVSGEAP